MRQIFLRLAIAFIFSKLGVARVVFVKEGFEGKIFLTFVAGRMLDFSELCTDPKPAPPCVQSPCSF